MVVASKACVACVESYCDVRGTSPGDRQTERPLQELPLCKRFLSATSRFAAVAAASTSTQRISPMSREMALVAYRNLLRSARIAFQGRPKRTSSLNRSATYIRTGDSHVLSNARLEVRRNFENNRHLQTGTEEYTKSIAQAEEVAKFLRENVVQGEATGGDNYSMR